nr:MAG TPA: hypothetical protein [Caudoviricetes sp.]
MAVQRGMDRRFPNSGPKVRRNSARRLKMPLFSCRFLRSASG